MIALILMSCVIHNEKCRISYIGKGLVVKYRNDLLRQSDSVLVPIC